MTNRIKQLSEDDIKQIKYLLNQGPYTFNRTNLIKNLWQLNDVELEYVAVNLLKGLVH